jgi:hypothetical protein
MVGHMMGGQSDGRQAALGLTLPPTLLVIAEVIEWLRYTSPELAQSGRHDRAQRCPLSRVKRTWAGHARFENHLILAEGDCVSTACRLMEVRYDLPDFCRRMFAAEWRPGKPAYVRISTRSMNLGWPALMTRRSCDFTKLEEGSTTASRTERGQ